MKALEEELAKAQARVKELEADVKAAGEGKKGEIRFLEKENLELMKESKELKTQVLQVRPWREGHGPGLLS